MKQNKNRENLFYAVFGFGSSFSYPQKNYLYLFDDEANNKK